MANPVWEVLQPLTEWQLVRANQNAAPPAKPYATYRVGGAAPLGFAHGPLAVDGTAKLTSPMLLRVELNFFGPGSEAQARRVHLMFGTWASQMRMQAHNLSLARLVAITDASGVVDDPQSQDRTVLEFTLNATDVTDDLLGVIEHVILAPDPDVPPGDPMWNSQGCAEVISSPDATTQPPE